MTVRPLAPVLLAAALFGCAPAPTSQPSVADVPVTASDEQAGFRLELVLPRVNYRVGEEITGRAVLTAVAPIEVAGSGSGLIGFSLHDVDRGRSVLGGQDSDCRAYGLDPQNPYSTGLIKSGGYDPADPSEDWIEAFLRDPVYRLPAGTWEIEVWTSFLGRGCEPPAIDLSAKVRIVVTD